MLADVNDIQHGDGRIRSRGCTGRLLQAGPDEISIDTSVDHLRERTSDGFVD